MLAGLTRGCTAQEAGPGFPSPRGPEWAPPCPGEASWVLGTHTDPGLWAPGCSSPVSPGFGLLIGSGDNDTCECGAGGERERSGADHLDLTWRVLLQ